MKRLLSMLLALCMAGAFVGCSSDDGSQSTDTNTHEASGSFGNLGSASEMEGTTVVLSIFANDSNASWDWDSDTDLDTADDMLTYTGIATSWLTEQAKQYDCDAKFIYDWSKDDNLTYDAQINGSLLSEDEFESLSDEYINNNIDSKEILKQYNADNIIYTFFLNTKESLDATSNTWNYYEDMEYPYEICYIYAHCDGTEETPAAIAHEMLHTFGAPDLYSEDTDGYNYGITKEYVNELEYEYSNDIMFTTFDAETADPYYDKISNEFTEIDAYYVGLTDHSSVVDEWGFEKSQHVS